MRSFKKFIWLFVLAFLHTVSFSQAIKDSSQYESLKIKELEQTIPTPVGWVNDFAEILTDYEIKKLDSIVANYEKKTTVEISVVTVNRHYVSEDNFDSYSLALAIKWGIGKKEKNNGILIMISPDLRRIRIRNGYGIEKLISNEETQQIIDEYSLPQFRNGDYFSGLQSTILELIKKLEEKD